jgi:hypothetical protein
MATPTLGKGEKATSGGHQVGFSLTGKRNGRIIPKKRFSGGFVSKIRDTVGNFLNAIGTKPFVVNREHVRTIGVLTQ